MIKSPSWFARPQGSAIPAVLLIVLFHAAAALGSQLAQDDFESGLERWLLGPAEHIEIVVEPGTTNHVLRLTPKRGDFVEAVLASSLDSQNVRFEGRFLFPTEGHGYLGFIYNYEKTSNRRDSGCLYVKSNGSYIRVSPHYDGNPSWRLYEEMKFDLAGDRRISTGVWYQFRLDVRGELAELFIGQDEAQLAQPVVRFDGFPGARGGLGLEARPGRGEPVWVDDITVTQLEESAPEVSAPGPISTDWEILGPFLQVEGDPTAVPELPQDGWRQIQSDARGAIITGLETQYRSGEETIAYLRTHIDITEETAVVPAWWGVSSANRLDVWFRGHYRGTVAPERFIWSDFASSSERPGARIPVTPIVGRNELLIRVHGDNFAGGGYYSQWLTPPGSGR